MRLCEESSDLTTFSMPFGRYKWLCPPFGINTAPEEFQRRQHEKIEGLEGVQVIAYDFLVYGQGDSCEEAVIDHDRNLRRFLDRAREVNLKLNKHKMKLRLTEVKCIGHMPSSEGLKPDPDKVRAISEMPIPEDKKAVQWLIGYMCQLSSQVPAQLISDSRAIEKIDRQRHSHFQWLQHHSEAFDQIKEMLTSDPVLKYYDINEEVVIQYDASQAGLGATLLQQERPVTSH